MRPLLPQSQIHPEAQKEIANFHPEFLAQVQKAIQSHDWVIVGMGQNPVVGSAKKYLKEKNITFHSLNHGNYFSGWKPRLAVKLWSGWPTFPQVFHKGVLIGGFSNLKKYQP